jgi:hypothetical protein
MNDTDIYDARHRAPNRPPAAAVDTGSTYATPRVDARRPPIHNRGDAT